MDQPAAPIPPAPVVAMSEEEKSKDKAARKRRTLLKLRALVKFGAFSPQNVEDQGYEKKPQRLPGQKQGRAGLMSTRVKRQPVGEYGTYGALAEQTETGEVVPTDRGRRMLTFIKDFEENQPLGTHAKSEQQTTQLLLSDVARLKTRQADRLQQSSMLFERLMSSRDRQELEELTRPRRSAVSDDGYDSINSSMSAGVSTNGLAYASSSDYDSESGTDHAYRREMYRRHREQFNKALVSGVEVTSNRHSALHPASPRKLTPPPLVEHENEEGEGGSELNQQTECVVQAVPAPSPAPAPTVIVSPSQMMFEASVESADSGGTLTAPLATVSAVMNRTFSTDPSEPVQRIASAPAAAPEVERPVVACAPVSRKHGDASSTALSDPDPAEVAPVLGGIAFEDSLVSLLDENGGPAAGGALGEDNSISGGSAVVIAEGEGLDDSSTSAIRHASSSFVEQIVIPAEANVVAVETSGAGRSSPTIKATSLVVVRQFLTPSGSVEDPGAAGTVGTETAAPAGDAAAAPITTTDTETAAVTVSLPPRANRRSLIGGVSNLFGASEKTKPVAAPTPTPPVEPVGATTLVENEEAGLVAASPAPLSRAASLVRRLSGIFSSRPSSKESSTVNESTVRVPLTDERATHILQSAARAFIFKRRALHRVKGTKRFTWVSDSALQQAMASTCNYSLVCTALKSKPLPPYDDAFYCATLQRMVELVAARGSAEVLRHVPLDLAMATASKTRDSDVVVSKLFLLISQLCRHALKEDADRRVTVCNSIANSNFATLLSSVLKDNIYAKDPIICALAAMALYDICKLNDADHLKPLVNEKGIFAFLAMLAVEHGGNLPIMTSLAGAVGELCYKDPAACSLLFATGIGGTLLSNLVVYRSQADLVIAFLHVIIPMCEGHLQNQNEFCTRRSCEAYFEALMSHLVDDDVVTVLLDLFAALAKDNIAGADELTDSGLGEALIKAVSSDSLASPASLCALYGFSSQFMSHRWGTHRSLVCRFVAMMEERKAKCTNALVLAAIESASAKLASSEVSVLSIAGSVRAMILMRKLVRRMMVRRRELKQIEAQIFALLKSSLNDEDDQLSDEEETKILKQALVLVCVLAEKNRSRRNISRVGELVLPKILARLEKFPLVGAATLVEVETVNESFLKELNFFGVKTLLQVTLALSGVADLIKCSSKLLLLLGECAVIIKSALADEQCADDPPGTHQLLSVWKLRAVADWCYAAFETASHLVLDIAAVVLFYGKNREEFKTHVATMKFCKIVCELIHSRVAYPKELDHLLRIVISIGAVPETREVLGDCGICSELLYVFPQHLQSSKVLIGICKAIFTVTESSENNQTRMLVSTNFPVVAVDKIISEITHTKLTDQIYWAIISITANHIPNLKIMAKSDFFIKLARMLAENAGNEIIANQCIWVLFKMAPNANAGYPGIDAKLETFLLQLADSSEFDTVKTNAKKAYRVVFKGRKVTPSPSGSRPGSGTRSRKSSGKGSRVNSASSNSRPATVEEEPALPGKPEPAATTTTTAAAAETAQLKPSEDPSTVGTAAAADKPASIAIEPNISEFLPVFPNPRKGLQSDSQEQRPRPVTPEDVDKLLSRQAEVAAHRNLLRIAAEKEEVRARSPVAAEAGATAEVEAEATAEKKAAAEQAGKELVVMLVSKFGSQKAQKEGIARAEEIKSSMDAHHSYDGRTEAEKLGTIRAARREQYDELLDTSAQQVLAQQSHKSSVDAAAVAREHTEAEAPAGDESPEEQSTDVNVLVNSSTAIKEMVTDSSSVPEISEQVANCPVPAPAPVQAPKDDSFSPTRPVQTAPPMEDMDQTEPPESSIPDMATLTSLSVVGEDLKRASRMLRGISLQRTEKKESIRRWCSDFEKQNGKPPTTGDKKEIASDFKIYRELKAMVKEAEMKVSDLSEHAKLIFAAFGPDCYNTNINLHKDALAELGASLKADGVRGNLMETIEEMQRISVAPEHKVADAEADGKYDGDGDGVEAVEVRWNNEEPTKLSAPTEDVDAAGREFSSRLKENQASVDTPAPAPAPAPVRPPKATGNPWGKGKNKKVKVNVNTDFDNDSLESSSFARVVPTTTPVAVGTEMNPFTKKAKHKEISTRLPQQAEVKDEDHMSFQQILDAIDVTERELKTYLVAYDELVAKKKGIKRSILKWGEDFKAEHHREPKSGDKKPVEGVYEQYKLLNIEVKTLEMKKAEMEEKLWQYKVNLKIAE